jgi:cytochrome b subunit of formate dehydrogenase
MTPRAFTSSSHWIPLLATLALLAPITRAQDPEGCLTCHQYRGLSRLDKDGKRIEMFFVDPSQHAHGSGPHARVRCTGCHERAQVEVFPHKPVTPVDCARTCHITSGRDVETRFAHDRVAHMLEGSVHTAKVLERSNELLGSPLAAGQSRCLLCHDEPMFRKTGADWTAREAPIARCNTCHDEQLRLPVNTTFNYWHVHARSQPARDNKDLVRVCATCHANEKVREEFKLKDAALSYLASFHGKATQLNSATASCLDCHVAEEQNVHVMLSHKQAGSPTHPDNVADTCRSPACHRTAGEQISSAAIHLDLSRSSGIEWFIAIVFVGMIVSTFGPSMVITLLKLVNLAIGRDDPRHHHHLERAKAVMATPEGRAKVRRFTLHQRLQHWFLVLTFTTLCLTGFPMKFADRPWAAWVINALGGLTAVRYIHRSTGAALVIGFLYHAGYVFNTMRKRRKTTGESWWKVFFNLPLCMNPRDLKEMMALLAFLVGIRRTRPDGHRFTAEEKFEYFGVFWGTMLLGLTGFLMWFNGYVSRYLPGRVITVSNLVHSFEAFLALLHVGILHLATVVFSPVVFPISPAMFTGDTRPEEMAEAHSAMLADHDERDELPISAAAPVVSTAEVRHV